MINRAIIVNGDYIVSQKIEHIYEGDIVVDCNAILKTFLASPVEEIEGGKLYATGCIGLTEASMIIAAKLKKAVFSRSPETSDEMCAIELLKEQGIETVINPNIIL